MDLGLHWSVHQQAVGELGHNAMVFSGLRKIRFKLQCLMMQDDGQDLVEYGLVLLLASTAVVAVLGRLAGDIALMYTNIASAFPII